MIVFMQRDPQSHKGDNGRVAVIGGSATMHGAPLFAALAAEASGVDLLYVALPKIHEHVARMQSLNFQVHPFAGDELAHKDVDVILELLATVDCAVIGPGLARSPAAQGIVKELIESAPCPLVLDASALQEWTLGAVKGKGTILTPHLGELERMGIAPEDITNIARAYVVTILAKGQTDRIAGPTGECEEVHGGNAGLTVGGTGDALAGLTAGLIAQGMCGPDAAALASRTIKKAGEKLFEKKGYAYTTREVIEEIPLITKQ
jgi:NAD(P)H-hydrate epimerase